MSNHRLTRENLLSALPKPFLEDPELLALAECAAWALEEHCRELDRLLIYPRLDELDEGLLDILAQDFKVDWWDGDYSPEEKRRTLKSSWQVHKTLGTRAAVEKAASAVYPNTKVQEWFEYGGEPYRFKLDVGLGEFEWDRERHKRLMRGLNCYKNLRSHLEALEYHIPPAELENHQVFFLASLLTYLNRVQEQEFMSLALFRLLLREQNREETALAIVQWCGVAERDRERLTRLLLGGWRGENRKGFAMSGQGYGYRTRTKDQLSLTRLTLQTRSGWQLRSRPGFTGTARVNNWGQELVRLDGRRRLDGSWRLGQHLKKGLSLEGLLLRWRQSSPLQLALGPVCVYLGRARTGSKPTAGLGFPVAVRNRESAALPELSSLLRTENRQLARAGPVKFWLAGGRYETAAGAGLCLRAEARSQGRTSQHMTMTFAAANPQSAAAFVTADTMWRLDGAFRFDGTRKWNASIERMDL